MRHWTRTVHQVAYCSECNKIWENYVDFKARKSAYQHAKNTGHKVTVETGSVTTYN